MQRDCPLTPEQLLQLDRDALTDYINALVRNLRDSIAEESATAGCIDRQGSRRDLMVFARLEGHFDFVAALEAALHVARARRASQLEWRGDA